jgi:hypothetical protein
MVLGSLPEPDARRDPLPHSQVAPPAHEADVVVCGGGTGGALAAIAAARQGASTLLLEASTGLGGMGTGGGIHIYYHGVAGGLQDEVDSRVDALSRLFGPAQGFHPEAKKVVLEQMALEAGVELAYETTITGSQTEASAGASGVPRPSSDLGVQVQQAAVGHGKVYYLPRPVELEGGPLAATYRDFLAFAGVRPIAIEPDHPRLHAFTVPLEAGTATVLCNRTGARQEVRLAGARLTVGENLTGIIVTGARGEVTGVECTGGSATADGPLTEGDAHVLVASLDGIDLRHSRRLMVLPITEGQLAIHSAAAWRNPVLDLCEPAGSSWRTLAATPLRPESGAFRLKLDDSLVRSVIMIREAEK